MHFGGGSLVKFKHYIVETTSDPTTLIPKELIPCNRLSMGSFHSREKVELEMVYHIQYTKNSVYRIWYTERIGVKMTPNLNYPFFNVHFAKLPVDFCTLNKYDVYVVSSVFTFHQLQLTTNYS